MKLFLFLYFIFFIIFFIIIKRLLNKKNEIKICKECPCLQENNYCLYLKKKIKNLNKLNCIQEE